MILALLLVTMLLVFAIVSALHYRSDADYWENRYYEQRKQTDSYRSRLFKSRHATDVDLFIAGKLRAGVKNREFPLTAEEIEEVSRALARGVAELGPDHGVTSVTTEFFSYSRHVGIYDAPRPNQARRITAYVSRIEGGQIYQVNPVKVDLPRAEGQWRYE